MITWRNVLYEHTESINGFDFRFIAIVEEGIEMGDLRGNAKEEYTHEKIWKGELVEFTAIVQVRQIGQLLGEDILGSCCYESYEAFHTTYASEYYARMVETVPIEAWTKINLLKGFDHEKNIHLGTHGASAESARDANNLQDIHGVGNEHASRR